MHFSRSLRLDPRTLPGRAGLSTCVAVLVALASSTGWGQAPAPAPAAAASATAGTLPAAAAPASRPATAVAAAASRPASARNNSAAKANAKPQTTRPLWRDLKPADQVALAPLAGTWDTISAAQKRKWLALSRNYPKLAPDEQGKLQSRMTDWVALSPQQRTQARLSFAETQQLAPDDKKAKWEAYQALPAEEKKKLAASAAKPPPAAAVKPVPTSKLATIPKPKLGDPSAPRGVPLRGASAAQPSGAAPAPSAAAR